jgi:hypothetical protein
VPLATPVYRVLERLGIVRQRTTGSCTEERVQIRPGPHPIAHNRAGKMSPGVYDSTCVFKISSLGANLH